MPLNLKNFDLKDYLNEHSVEWRLSGTKNVGEACFLGVCCPFCRKIDRSFHCGIFNEQFNFSCFRCGASGSLYDLLHELTGIEYQEFYQIVKHSYLDDPAPTSQKIRDRLFPKIEQSENKYKDNLPLPPRSKNTEQFNQFLKYRKFSEKKIKYYGAYFCNSGEYKGRIILPIYNKTGQRVAFQSRNLQRVKQKRGTSYLNPRFPFGDHLYCLNKHKKKWALIVEGIFDRWRIGQGSLATFRNNLTKAQLLLLLQYNIKTIYIGWDSDAISKSIKVAEEISPLFNCVKLLILPDREDPDTLGRDKIFELMENAEKI